jgi:hypothetical protein
MEGMSGAGPVPGHVVRALREGQILRLLQLAMAQRTPISGLHHGQRITASPHVLGRRGDDLWVLIFGVRATPEGSTPLRWQWMRAEELQEARLEAGFWLTAPGERPSADFLDRIIADVGPPGADPSEPAPEDDLPAL